MMKTNNWSIGKRLFVLSFSLILLIGIIGFIPFQLNKFYTEKITKFSKVIVPAGKTLTLADMMHDGIRGNILETLMIIESDKNDISDKLKELTEEEKEFTENFIKHLTLVDNLYLTAEIKEKIDSVMIDSKKYVEFSNTINKFANKKNMAEVEKVMPEFNKVFKVIENKMEEIHEDVNKYNDFILDETNQFSKSAIAINISILVFALFTAIILSIFIIYKLKKQLTGLMMILIEQTKMLSHGAVNLQKNSATLSEMTTRQAAAIAETAASMEEMSSMLTQTSKNSAHNKVIVEEGLEGAHKGKENIVQMLSAMESIHASNTRLEGISTLITTIANKTKVINEIVSETRLLSFNASIEAARAGVHGKGFAVVAEEVGKLASMSGASANEIRELLESSTTEVSNVIKDIRERIQSGKVVFKQCESSFDFTSESLEKITEGTKGIVSSTREQELGVKQTTTAMRQMDIATKKTATIAEEQEKESENLSRGVKNIEGVISQLNALAVGRKALRKAN